MTAHNPEKAFTDSIIKQWKEDPNHQGMHTCNGRCALLRRLEAAEKCIEAEGNIQRKFFFEAREVWRKAAGR